MSQLVERRRRRVGWLRRIVLLVAAVWFAIPLISLVDFSVRYPLTGKVDGSAWAKLFSGQQSASGDILFEGLTNSLIMCAMTVVLMVGLLLPTMVWTRLRVPRFNRLVEFICLLPLTIPAVVLVVGLAPIYQIISTRILDGSTIWLAFAYVVLVLPFSYRSLDAGLSAMDLVTLSEAAHSFGASGWQVIWRIVLPNIRSAVLSACFITVAVVLGEFTLARMLARNNLQTSLFQVNLSDGQTAAAVSLIALVGTTGLLVVMDSIAGVRAARKSKARTP